MRDLTTRPRSAPVELIPPKLQALWRMPAVLNFALGGLGAGFYLTAVIAAGFDASPALGLAAWLGPALVLAGFAAVATEAGRPFRGPRVLARIRTSWMSRELLLGGAFVALAGAELVAPAAGLRALAALAAAGLVIAQGLILRHARGIAAWDVSVMPIVFFASAIVSGMGLFVLVEVAGGRTPGGAVLGGGLAVLALAAVVWLAFVTWSDEPAFARAVAPLCQGATAVELVGIGYVAPFALAALGLAFPGWTDATAALAGAAMIAGQMRAKTALILTAGQLRPITLSNLTVSSRRSS